MSKTKILSFVAVCLVILTVLLMGGKNKKAYVQYHTINDAIEETMLEDKKQLYFSKKERKEMKKVNTSEMISLYCDESTGSIAVYDTSSKKLWRSIPEAYAGVKTGTLLLEVISDGAVYTLYSQDSICQSEKSDDSLKYIYTFDSVLPDQNKVKISIPVVFTLQRGTLTAEINCSEISNESKNVILKAISVLPFLGADREKSKGDYLFLPDGSGLTVDLSENPEEFEALTVPVYGGDVSKGEPENKKALIGAFGIKKDTAAFVGIIEEGAALASVKASKALSKTGLNSVGAYFEITQTGITEKGKFAVSKTSYDGKVKVAYRFLSMQNADYIGMASAVREVLIRNGSLPMTSEKSEGEYPFNLSIVGVGYDEKVNQSKIFTSYSQTYDILSSLMAKGVSGIKLRYRGLFDGGINQRNIENAKFTLGDTDELRELMSYAKSQNINVFAEIKLITASEKGDFADKAVSIGGGYTVKQAEKFEAYNSNFISSDKIGALNEKMLVKMRNTDFDGISISDAGKYICSSFSKNGATSIETAEILSEQLSSVSANKKLMIDTGNLYSVKFASSVVNLPSTSFYKDRYLCATVPFIEAVYHGFFDYSLSPINSSDNGETMFLRYVEYGAVPHFEWYYTDDSTDESKDKYNYNNSINEAQLYYQRMSSALSDLRDARITAHEKVKKNVYMTEYESSTKIYVNYNKSAVTVDGVTIEPRSFVRVG